jgi:pimeloyl-ACP methyl ester carboxylesterase
VIWGDLDFPHVQDRSRHVADAIPNASRHVLTGTAHLPSLERPADVTDLLTAFIARDAMSDVDTPGLDAAV